MLKLLLLVLSTCSFVRGSQEEKSPPVSQVSSPFLSLPADATDADIMGAMETYVAEKNSTPEKNTPAVCSSLLLLSREPSVSPLTLPILPAFITKVRSSGSVVRSKVQRLSVDQLTNILLARIVSDLKAELEACKASIRAQCFACSMCAALFLTHDQHAKHVRTVPNSCFTLQKAVAEYKIKHWHERLWK